MWLYLNKLLKYKFYLILVKKKFDKKFKKKLANLKSSASLQPVNEI